MTEKISFEATVRQQRTNLPGLFGLIRSKKLGAFVDRVVIVTVELKETAVLDS